MSLSRFFKDRISGVLKFNYDGSGLTLGLWVADAVSSLDGRDRQIEFACDHLQRYYFFSVVAQYSLLSSGTPSKQRLFNLGWCLIWLSLISICFTCWSMAEILLLRTSPMADDCGSLPVFLISSSDDCVNCRDMHNPSSTSLNLDSSDMIRFAWLVFRSVISLACLRTRSWSHSFMPLVAASNAPGKLLCRWMHLGYINNFGIVDQIPSNHLYKQGLADDEKSMGRALGFVYI